LVIPIDDTLLSAAAAASTLAWLSPSSEYALLILSSRARRGLAGIDEYLFSICPLDDGSIPLLALETSCEFKSRHKDAMSSSSGRGPRVVTYAEFLGCCR